MFFDLPCVYVCVLPFRLLAEAAADDRTRDVAVHGLTLRQLYQLKKDADAWNLVCKKKMADAEALDKQKKKKRDADKVSRGWGGSRWNKTHDPLSCRNAFSLSLSLL